ncbi:hypothetical protein [Actinoplanes regularis]|uniref:hypothetical protein n=1 Tax=Actinoplanes regularis TaxID=52697 RepID=UPI0024A32DCB|nr:hypothetical protein [Actinoplanes regularis]GLW33334.1 hypothetical protein Areg01_62720 [Actinoplanes regularis]
MNDDSPGGAGALLELSGRFQPRRYVIGHSELEIRSVAASGRVTSLRFFGVMAVKLKSGYNSLTVTDADEQLRSEVLSFIGAAGRSSAGKVRVFALSRDSFVACLSLVVSEFANANDTDGELIYQSGRTGSSLD